MNLLRIDVKEKKSLQCQKKPVCFSGKKGKKNYCYNLDLRNVTDEKKFWKTLKPFFTDKRMNHDKIILVEDDEIILENEQISESLKTFFLCCNKLEYSSV